MGLLNTVRRLSRIAPPGVHELPEEELTWPAIRGRSVQILEAEPPALSRNLVLYTVAADLSGHLVLPEPTECGAVGLDQLTLATGSADLSHYLTFSLPAGYEAAPVSEPEVIDLGDELYPAAIEVLDLLDPLARPAAHGTIYVKKEEEIRSRGEARTQVRVQPQNLRQRLDPKKPRGLDIFEMLLPILMPPATTEFRDDLLFPDELYPFQRAGVKWLFENEAALLADDMGLGKTVQAITAFRALVRRSLAKQALVICPKSVVVNWMRELERWAPELIAIRIHGSVETRHLAWRAYIGKCHVLVATYDTVRQDQALVAGRLFELIVADEVQRIKNPDAVTSRVVRQLAVRHRWGLSGTPLENRLDELIAVFGFIKPGLFRLDDAAALSPRAVRDRVAPYILRRRKEEALPDLPPKVIDTKWVELTDSQRECYDRAEQEGVVRLRGRPDVTIQHVLALIQKLKQICNFDPLTGGSAKAEFLLDYLDDACVDGQKVLVVSQYVETLKELSERLSDYEPLVYKGSLTVGQRSQVEAAFASNDHHKVLLLSLRAGGLGLNLMRANYVLHFDRWWNPAVERQAEDRTHRIGQERTVFVTRLICHNTIEERIERLLERKKILFQQVVDELADVSLERVLSEEELFGLFGLTAARRTRDTAPVPPRAVATQQGVRSQPTAVVIRPDTPFSNVVRLPQILRESEGYIWWADPYFNIQGLEELIVAVDPALVSEVRILSGPRYVDDRARRDFLKFRAELEGKGIDAQWRVLVKFSHDRFILSGLTCFNMAPVDTILERPKYSEILETPNRPPFEEWWEKGTPIESWH